MDEEKRVELLINYQRELGAMIINCNVLTQYGMNEIWRRYFEVCDEIRCTLPPHH